MWSFDYIYDRYGQIIFRSNGYSNAWNLTFNGSPVPVGTYYYMIDLKSGKEANITGWVFIVR
jgi:gliding motility-associated-like protein